MRRFGIALAPFCCLLLIWAASTRGQAAKPASRPAATRPASRPATQPAGHPRVQMRIRQGNEDWGWIVLELNEEKAPITVGNFLRYVDEGYYNGTIFHRVIPTFMIQGGGFTAPGDERRQGLHDPIKNESKNGLSNARGTISMARTPNPHSATSQFFINVANNKAGLDAGSRGEWGYAVFGKVVEGMDVVDKIKNVKTKPGGENSEPVDPPVIVVAERVK